MNANYWLGALGLAISCTAMADGYAVDKVYHPYVLANEREVEWRFTSRQSDDGNVLSQRLGYGHALSSMVVLEGYLIANRDSAGDFSTEAFELESRWMLTEQGQYWADWGALAEIERSVRDNEWRLSTGVIIEKELGRSSVTVNALLSYPWGDQVDQELQTELSAQYRYRWHPAFQPAIELYSGDDFIGVGPSLIGLWRYAGQEQLKYEFGFIAEVSQRGDGKDHTLRFALEWEF